MTTWLPLESNSEVLTKYIQKLGVSDKFMIADVLGLDKELLEFLPQPVSALIFLFPCNEKFEKYREDEDKALKANPPECPKDLFFMKQTIHNACGTIALVHAILNNPQIELKDGVLANYFNKTKDLSPDERGKLLEGDSAFTNTHEELAKEGQTAAPDLSTKVNHHFIALVHKNGELYELDGRKSFPIKHGATNPEKFLYDAAEVCKKFMNLDPHNLGFTVLAITPNQN
ncbi:ubiquitin carboxyl-terminal hydrolase [Culicoides brevitarsis]|uniref:ubiquitin carboxyl-terminal hydrolase n=1 Tax=Culicoides brevitarsis TaxID=469753 RepID=UPI00307BB709